MNDSDEKYPKFYLYSDIILYPNSEAYKMYQNIKPYVDFITSLFNIQTKEDDMSELKKLFDSIYTKKHWKHCFLLQLLNNFAMFRPKLHSIALFFYDKIIEEEESIDKYNKNYYNLLKNIKHGQWKFHKEQELILNDDFDELLNLIIPNNRLFDQQTKYYDYFYDNDTRCITNPLDFSCYSGSPKCFKYFLLNNYKETSYLGQFAIAGGNYEIIDILTHKGYSFDECLLTSIKYHRYSLSDWLLTNYNSSPIPCWKCIEYFNLMPSLFYINESITDNELQDIFTIIFRSQQLFLFYEMFKYVNNIDWVWDILLPIVNNEDILQFIIDKFPYSPNISINTIQNSVLSTLIHGNLALIKYLVEDIGFQIKDIFKDIQTDIFTLCRSNCPDIVRFFVERNDIEVKYKQNFLFWACCQNNLTIVEFLIDKYGIDIERRNDDG